MEYKLIFSLVSLIFEAILIFLIFKLYNSNIKYLKELIYPIFTNIIMIPIYTGFLLSTSHTVALILDSVYFLLNDWVALFMMIFTIRYTSEYKPTLFIKILTGLCFADSLSLLISPFTGHVFELTIKNIPNFDQYWSINYLNPFYIHLALCYIIVLTTIIQLFVATYKAPFTYKSKYSSILATFIFVILVNLLSYSQDAPLDISVFLYALLASYIAYYSIFKMEKKIITNTLQNLNEESNDLIMYYNIRENCIYLNSNAKKILSDSNILEQLKCTTANRLEIIADELKEKLKTSKDKILEIIINGKQHFYTTEYKQIFENDISIGSYLALRDNTDEIMQYRKEQYNANHDTLTGIYNRQKFFEKCEEKNKKSQENYMICINIRDFKLINEIFGDETGDQVLNFLATLIEKQFDNNTIYGRISDDKFAIFIPKKDFDEKNLLTLSKNIQHILDKNTYHIQLSFGICESHQENINVIYDKAKMAVDKIQNNVEENIGYYDSLLMEKALAEKNITSEFENALSNGQIQMYLQPVYDQNSKIIAAEALARWDHPEKGLRLPHNFIDVLEKTGLIPKLDTFIWNEALKFIEKNKNHLENDFFISVNISSRDIYYIDVFETLKNLVNQYSIPSSCIVLEFNEDIFSVENNKGQILVENLKNYGFKCIMDKFGTAYTSLNLLKDINCDYIKINDIFISQTVDSEKCRIIVNSMISMSQDIGIKTTAVGIETSEQYFILRGFDCDYYQGNYFSKPVKTSDFEKLI